MAWSALQGDVQANYNLIDSKLVNQQSICWFIMQSFTLKIKLYYLRLAGKQYGYVASVTIKCGYAKADMFNIVCQE